MSARRQMTGETQMPHSFALEGWLHAEEERPVLRERAVRLVRGHRSGYPSPSAAGAAVAKQVGVGHESLRR